MEEVDAKDIGFQLQSLLNIPPIKKKNDYEQMKSRLENTSFHDLNQPLPITTAWSSNEYSPPPTLEHTSKTNLRMPPSSTAIDQSLPIQSQLQPCPDKQSINNTLNKSSDTSSGRQKVTLMKRDTDYQHNNALEQKNQETTPTNFPTKKGQSHYDTRKTMVVESSFTVNRSKNRIIALIDDLLKNPNCPQNLVNMKKKLTETALAENTPSYYLQYDKTVLDVFKQHGIQPLAKRSTKFVKAKFFCSICNYHMDMVSNVISHASNSRHSTLNKIKDLEHDLEDIPSPSDNHQLNLHFLIVEIMKTFGIDDNERDFRYSVLLKLNSILAPQKWQLEPYGSSVSGFGFKDSNINFHLDLSKAHEESAVDEAAANTEHGASVVVDLIKILELQPFVRDIAEDPASLSVKFYDTEADRICSISIALHSYKSSGILLAQLFKEYDKLDCRVRPLVVAFRHWARLTQVDDREAGLLHPIAYTIMVLKHLHDVCVLPYIIDPDDTVVRRSFRRSEDNPGQVWSSPNDNNLGMLWLSLLRKYSIEFPYKELVVSLTRPDFRKTEDEKLWSRKISIEDPIMPKSNLARSAINNKVCEYINDRIKDAFKYFGIPRIGNTPLYEKTIPLSRVQHLDQIYFFGKPKPVAVVAPIQVQSPEGETDQPRRSVQQVHGKLLLSDDHGSIPHIRMINLPDYKGDIKVHCISLDLRLMHELLSTSEYYYEFSTEIFQAGEVPPKHCRSCGGDSHVKRDCPEEMVPSLTPVSHLDNLTLRVLESVMLRIHNEKALSDADLNDRNIILGDIYRNLVGTYPDIEMFLFGSTNNGFGLRGSDVDINLRFKNHPITKADFRTEEVAQKIKKIAEILRGSGCMQELLPIPSAKVPIVKFKHRATQLEGDLSLSNELAIQNTKLLRSYTEIDTRVKVLGCYLKQLTKLCDISDASKGSLSSYAYVLMMIHFLQQHYPPVLPVLQQIPAENRPENIIDGWNAYFFQDITQLTLPAQWNGFHRNKESVSQLLLAFIKYYTETFKFEENVVTISQLEPLTRKEKRWNSPSLICIEDPFEKSHNLGVGLTRRMSVYIIKTLHHYREVFSHSISNFSPLVDYAAYYLDPRIIRGTMVPPVDRQCRNCNRIGHFASSCTVGMNGNTSDPEEDYIPPPMKTFAKKTSSPPRNENMEHTNMDIRQLNHFQSNQIQSGELPGNKTVQSKNVEGIRPVEADEGRRSPLEGVVDSFTQDVKFNLKSPNHEFKNNVPVGHVILGTSPEHEFQNMGQPVMFPFLPGFIPPRQAHPFIVPGPPPGFGIIPMNPGMLDPRFHPLPPQDPYLQRRNNF